MNLLLRPGWVEPATARRPFRRRQDGRIFEDVDDELIVLLTVIADR